ncbi:hypothetical protein MSTE_03189 [Mycobacteroides stephanolepidis]|uniref:Uncharacterized protein n=1 Tax=[Mycobacterium] stephanolepidis TaxID=1520670 RepID=A0A1Z4EZX8_9MYCO|nr:hypothetical protein MSTE_03189 [[Mycobacterium] stephanolepidis]
MARHTGIPDPFVDVLANLIQAIAEHCDEYLSPGVVEQAGRPPRSFRQTIADMSA